MTQTGGRVREGPRLPASLNSFSIALVTWGARAISRLAKLLSQGEDRHRSEGWSGVAARRDK